MPSFCASAPGKLVILGEYAVLDGAPALVMAVNRRARAEIAAVAGTVSRIETRAAQSAVHELAPGRPSGVALVDAVTARGEPRAAWQAVLDTTELYAGPEKLGLGSSAAALSVFAAVWRAFTRPAGAPVEPPGLDELIELHGRFQPGGSGVDVAASLTGGVLSYRLEPGRGARVGSVRLPNSVGFAGIFAGRSASTPDFVARYRNWGRERPGQAAEFRRRMGGVADVGCEAARSNDAHRLLGAIAEYGRGLDALGRAIGVEIVTREHRMIAAEARRFGVVYKVSGAGGGDLGLAFSDAPDALAAFEAAVAERGFGALELGVDAQGLVLEEQQ